MEDRDLFNNGDYGGIIEKYSSIDVQELDVWQLYWLCKSYYKLKEYNKCHRVYKIYKSKNTQNDLLKTTDLWCYYNTCVKPEEVDDEKVYRYAKYIISNCVQDGMNSPYETTVQKVIKRIRKSAVNPNFNKLYEWTGYLDPKKLSSAEKEKEVNGEKKILASDREHWYIERSKACIKAEKYEECIEVCEEGLKELTALNVGFHNNDDIWLKSRIAESKTMLGDLKAAKNILLDLVLKNENFSLRKTLAQVYEQLNDEGLARRYYLEAGLSRVGTMSGKINVIEKIGDFLVQDGNLKVAKMHYILVKYIRENEDWPIKQNLLGKLENLSDFECDIDVDISINNSLTREKLFERCQKLWNEKLIEYLPEGKGIVKNLIGDKRSGFIRSENGDIHFNTRNVVNSRASGDIINKNVTFNIIESYDRKRKTKSTEAINIRLV